MSARRQRGYPHDSGQGLVEFALVLPFLLVLVFGIIEFGNAFRTYQTVTNVAREGARQAVLQDCDQTCAEDVIGARLAGSGLNPDLADVTFSCNGTAETYCTTVNDEVGVLIQYPFTFRIFGPVMNMMCVGCGSNWGTFTLTTQTIMRHE